MAACELCMNTSRRRWDKTRRSKSVNHKGHEETQGKSCQCLYRSRHTGSAVRFLPREEGNQHSMEVWAIRTVSDLRVLRVFSHRPSFAAQIAPIGSPANQVAW